MDERVEEVSDARWAQIAGVLAGALGDLMAWTACAAPPCTFASSDSAEVRDASMRAAGVVACHGAGAFAYVGGYQGQPDSSSELDGTGHS